MKPTVYKPEYCQKLIESQARGEHIIEFAASVSVSKKTVFEWLDKHPEFAAAYEEGKPKAMAWYLKEGRKMVKGGNGNGAVWKSFMANKFGWTEKIEQESRNQNLNVNADAAVKPEDAALVVSEIKKYRAKYHEPPVT